MGWFGDIIKGIGGVATSIIPGPVDDIIFEGATSLFGGKKQQQRRIPTSGGISPVGMRQPPSLPLLPQQEVIRKPGVRGAIERALPGGRTGFVTQGQQAAGATLPIVGAIATEPEIEEIQRRDCGPGRVLAMDGLCYPKRMLPASFRMHRPAPKPVVSAADRKAIRKANSAKKRLVKLTKDAGAHASLTKPRRK